MISDLLRRLRLSRDLTDSDLQTLFATLNRFLCDSQSVLLLLSLLPSASLTPLAAALFSANTEVARLATEILKKVEATEVGRLAIAGGLNYFFMLKY